jgi:hypothetical protein
LTDPHGAPFAPDNVPVPPVPPMYSQQPVAGQVNAGVPAYGQPVHSAPAPSGHAPAAPAVGQAPPPPYPGAVFPGGPMPFAPTPPTNRGANRLGVVALIFAGVSFLLAVIPPISFLTFVFAITAIVLAIIGLTRKGKPKGLSKAALILGIVAWLISMVVFPVFIGANAGDDDDDSSGSSSQAPVDEAAEEPAEGSAPEVVEDEVPAPEDLSAYAEIPERDFALLIKDPDSSVGKNLIVHGSIWQFDAASGKCSFLASTASTLMESDWEYSEDVMVYGGDGESDCALLDPVVEGDVVKMWVTNTGSYSYDTQIGGNTTVPLFEVKQIEVL